MAGISVNGAWINGYANTVEQAADELDSTAGTLLNSPLNSASFGQLGRTAGAAQAYTRAAAALLGQLSTASTDLRSAAANLRTVAGAHAAADAEHAQRFMRAYEQG
jgi:phage baseplate assembly protein gpV